MTTCTYNQDEDKTRLEGMSIWFLLFMKLKYMIAVFRDGSREPQHQSYNRSFVERWMAV
jgi:hypothetical protein